MGVNLHRANRAGGALRPLLAAAFVSLILAGSALVVSVEPPTIVTMVVAGDIMLSRNVAAKMKEAGDPLLPFRGVEMLLDSSDVNFANLETPLARPEDETGASGNRSDRDGASDGLIGGKSLIFAAPHRSVQALKRYRFRVVAMANNHAMDQGEDGLAYTIDKLAESGVQAVGTGRDLDQAWQPRIVELKGRRIGFLAASYASLNYGTSERNDYVARIEDLDRLRSGVCVLKSEADYIVVSMHAGDEYTAAPSSPQVTFAHAAIDAGADLVVGSHPHWLQPFEHYKTGLIFYSLGNFVFDLEPPPTRQGAAVKIFLGPRGLIQAEVIPIQIEGSCCPRPAGANERRSVLGRMRLVSTRIRTISQTRRDPELR